MMDRIELEAKTDRELLIILVERVNDTNKDIVDIHEKVTEQNSRLRSLELWRAGIVAVLGFISFGVGVFALYISLVG